jgi:hypothetical protein
MAITYRGVKGSKLTIAEIDSNFSYLDARDSVLSNRIDALPDSSQVSGIILNDVDSAYVQARQITYDFLDSSEVIALVDSAYVQARQLTFDFMDSAEVIALVDSAYVQARTPYIPTFGNDYVDSDTVVAIISSEGLDSDLVTKLVDSAYIQLRDRFQDSSLVTSTVDSSYIQIRVPESYLSTIVDSDYVEARVNWHDVNESIIPAVDSAYDLGTPTMKWKDLYLSGNTIYLGGVKLRAEQGNTALKVYDSNESEISFGGLNQSQVDTRIALNSQGFATVDSAGTLADSAANSLVPLGQAGEMLIYNTNNTRNFKRTSLFEVNDKFVEFYDEVLQEQSDAPTLADVFNTWNRFSHNSGGTYPANSSEMNAWVYNSGPNTISQPQNTSTATGFYSFEKYEDYTHSARFTSTDADNDIGFMVIAFVIDGGIEHTLSAVRQSNGNIGGIGTWALVYNIGQTSQAILSDNSASAPGSGGWNQWGNGTTISARKLGKDLTITTSQFNTTTLDNSTDIAFDLSSDSRTVRFVGPVPYGYGAWSQGGMTISQIQFDPDNPERLYWLDSSGTTVYEYNGATVTWDINPGGGLDSATGQIFHNSKNGRTYYIDGDSAHAIGTIRQFNDVIYQRPVNRLPDSAMIGDLGLKPGMFATADGVNWDPASKGGSVPYPVFWDGSAWNALY